MRSLATLGLGVALLVGCTGGGQSATEEAVGAPSTAYDSAADRSAPSQAGGAGSADEADSGDSSAASGVGGTAGGADGAGHAAPRLVISTGWVQVAVENPVTAADEVVALVEGVGGRIDSRSIVAEAEGQHPFASLVARIPSDDLTPTLDSLDAVGETVRSEIAAEDVTGTVQDIDARIRAKELSVTRLEALLASATTNDELIEAESALTTRQSELEELQTQRNRLGDQAAMSTITIELSVPSEVPPPVVVQSQGFSGGLAEGWGSLVRFVTSALVVVGTLVPWVVVLGLLGGVVLLARRVRRSRRTAPSTPAAATPATPAAATPTVAATPVATAASLGTDHGHTGDGDDDGDSATAPPPATPA